MSEKATETLNGWEIFHDMSTWDMIAVRPIGSRVYGEAVHFETWGDARAYATATAPSKEHATPEAPRE